MRNNFNCILFILLLLLLSSCGTFTKMRYSRGLKADFSLHRKSKEAETPVLKANKAEKKKQTPFQSVIFDSSVVVLGNYKNNHSDIQFPHIKLPVKKIRTQPKVSENNNNSTIEQPQVTASERGETAISLSILFIVLSLLSFLICLSFELIPFLIFLIVAILAFFSLVFAVIGYLRNLKNKIDKVKRNSIRMAIIALSILVISLILSALFIPIVY
ncbi:MAG: hypothetical protein V4613_11555 [Bacteroidota bacterium]